VQEANCKGVKDIHLSKPWHC
jgi:hypothetical protein